MPKLVSIDDQRYAALTLQSLRVTIGPLQASTTSLESQESYLTAGMLPYKNSSRALEIFTAYTVLSHGSIMLQTDLKLNNIIATPSSNLILTPLDEYQSW